jgi:hypothetical protein
MGHIMLVYNIKLENADVWSEGTNSAITTFLGHYETSATIAGAPARLTSGTSENVIHLT